MPTTLSAISTGYSNRSSPRFFIYASDIASTAAALSSMVTLAKRAKLSSTNRPLKAMRVVPPLVIPIQIASSVITIAVAQTITPAAASLLV